MFDDVESRKFFSAPPSHSPAGADAADALPPGSGGENIRKMPL